MISPTAKTASSNSSVRGVCELVMTTSFAKGMVGAGLLSHSSPLPRVCVRSACMGFSPPPSRESSVHT